MTLKNVGLTDVIDLPKAVILTKPSAGVLDPNLSKYLNKKSKFL